VGVANRFNGVEGEGFVQVTIPPLVLPNVEQLRGQVVPIEQIYLALHPSQPREDKGEEAGEREKEVEEGTPQVMAQRLDKLCIEKGLEYGKHARLMVIVRTDEEAKRVASLFKASTMGTDFLFPASREIHEDEAKNCDNLKALPPHGVAVILSESRRLEDDLIQDLFVDSHLHFLVMLFSKLRTCRVRTLCSFWIMAAQVLRAGKNHVPVGLAQRWSR